MSGNENCEKMSCWKDCIELTLKVVFVAVFCWGVCNAVCCMKSCNDTKTCCSAVKACSKTGAPVK